MADKGYRYRITAAHGEPPEGVDVGVVLVDREDKGEEHTWTLVNGDAETQATWTGVKVGTCELPGIPMSEFS